MLRQRQTNFQIEIGIDVQPTRSFVTLHTGNKKENSFMTGRRVDGVDGISDDIRLEEITQRSQRLLRKNQTLSPTDL